MMRCSQPALRLCLRARHTHGPADTAVARCYLRQQPLSEPRPCAAAAFALQPAASTSRALVSGASSCRSAFTFRCYAAVAGDGEKKVPATFVAPEKVDMSQYPPPKRGVTKGVYDVTPGRSLLRRDAITWRGRPAPEPIGRGLLFRSPEPRVIPTSVSPRTRRRLRRAIREEPGCRRSECQQGCERRAPARGAAAQQATGNDARWKGTLLTHSHPLGAVNTKADLRFNVAKADFLPQWIKDRLVEQVRRRSEANTPGQTAMRGLPPAKREPAAPHPIPILDQEKNRMNSDGELVVAAQRHRTQK